MSLQGKSYVLAMVKHIDMCKARYKQVCRMDVALPLPRPPQQAAPANQYPAGLLQEPNSTRKLMAASRTLLNISGRVDNFLVLVVKEHSCKQLSMALYCY